MLCISCLPQFAKQSWTNMALNRIEAPSYCIIRCKLPSKRHCPPSMLPELLTHLTSSPDVLPSTPLWSSRAETLEPGHMMQSDVVLPSQISLRGADFVYQAIDATSSMAFDVRNIVECNSTKLGIRNPLCTPERPRHASHRCACR